MGAGFLSVGAGGLVVSQQHAAPEVPLPVLLSSGPPYASEWVQQLADTEGVKQVLTAESMQNHHPALKRDHMVRQLHGTGKRHGLSNPLLQAVN